MVARIIENVRRLAEVISLILLVGVFIVCLMGVLARYVLNQPIAWSEELAMILLIWSVLLADALVTRDRDHVAFDLAWDVASPAVRRIILIVQGLLFASIFAAALPTIIDYVLFLWRERTSALEWRLDFVFSCFILNIAMLVVRLLAKSWRAIGSGWRREVQDVNAPGTEDNIG